MEEGEINLRLFLEELREDVYENPLCIEYEGREDPKTVLKKGLDWLKNVLNEIGWEGYYGTCY